MSTNSKVLQLLRNANLSKDKKSAIDALNGKLNELKDGQILINRYGDGSKCIIGIAYVKDTVRKMFLLESGASDESASAALDSVKDRITNLSGFAGDTYVANSDVDFINNATSLNDADKKLSAAIKNVSDASKGAVKSIEQVKKADEYTSADADKYIVTKADNSTSNLQLKFTPLSPSTLKMPSTMGDLVQGTTAADLREKTLSEILDSILFKTVYPTITDPSGTISFKDSFTNNSIVEVGTVAPQNENMNYTFNKGVVRVDDGTTANLDYVGDATGATYTYTYTPGAANTNAGVEIGGTAENNVALKEGKLGLGTYVYSGTIAYGGGTQFKDSKGHTDNPMQTTNKGEVANPHPAGSLKASNTLTINVSVPVYVDKNADGNFTKNTLQKWGSMKFTGIALSGTSADKPLQIKTPRKLKSVNSYNKVSGKYDTPQLNNFTLTNSAVPETFNGITVNYFLYKWTGGSLGGGNYEIITY